MGRIHERNHKGGIVEGNQERIIKKESGAIWKNLGSGGAHLQRIWGHMQASGRHPREEIDAPPQVRSLHIEVGGHTKENDADQHTGPEGTTPKPLQ